MIEKSKKLRTPSKKADKIGTAISDFASAGCICAGVVQIFLGNLLWTIRTVAIGTIAPYH